MPPNKLELQVDNTRTVALNEGEVAEMRARLSANDPNMTVLVPADAAHLLALQAERATWAERGLIAADKGGEVDKQPSPRQARVQNALGRLANWGMLGLAAVGTVAGGVTLLRNGLHSPEQQELGSRPAPAVAGDYTTTVGPEVHAEAAETTLTQATVTVPGGTKGSLPTSEVSVTIPGTTLTTLETSSTETTAAPETTAMQPNSSTTATDQAPSTSTTKATSTTAAPTTSRPPTTVPPTTAVPSSSPTTADSTTSRPQTTLQPIPSTTAGNTDETLIRITQTSATS